MKKKIIFIINILLISTVVALITQIFIWPHISNSSLLAKYQLNNRDKKTIVINKTEKITVKENFSLSKVAEKVSPAITKIYFLDKNKKGGQKIKMHSDNSTGVVLSSDGIIVTVLPDFSLTNKIIKVFLSDGREFIASIKNKDTFNGILILKIEADNLPVAPFGESSKLENGEKLILASKSIANDNIIFSLENIKEYTHSFTKKNIDFLFSDDNTEALVLDSVVDREFIGSPAIDFKGTLVGLTSIAKKGNRDVAFVIPLDNIKKSIRDISSNDKIKRDEKRFFGVYYLNIDKNLNILNNLDSDEGALVYSPSGKTGLAVLANSVGKKIGLKIYDIITQINGTKIDNENTLSKVVHNQDLKKDIKIKIIRKGKELELSTK